MDRFKIIGKVSAAVFSLVAFGALITGINSGLSTTSFCSTMKIWNQAYALDILGIECGDSATATLEWSDFLGSGGQALTADNENEYPGPDSLTKDEKLLNQSETLAGASGLLVEKLKEELKGNFQCNGACECEESFTSRSGQPITIITYERCEQVVELSDPSALSDIMNHGSDEVSWTENCTVDEQFVTAEPVYTPGLDIYSQGPVDKTTVACAIGFDEDKFDQAKQNGADLTATYSCSCENACSDLEGEKPQGEKL